MSQKFIIASIVGAMIVMAGLILMAIDSNPQGAMPVPSVNVETNDQSNRPIERGELLSAGAAFNYFGGPEGYVLTPENEAIFDYPQLVEAVVLFRPEMGVAFDGSSGMELAPAIKIAVYNNHLKQSVSVWIGENPQVANTALAVTPLAETVIGGTNAVRYTTDGQYRTQLAVIAHEGYIIVVSGAYFDVNSVIYRDFESLLNSFVFNRTEPTAMPQGKINPQVACKSALAYTTFTSSEAVNAFVAECVAGEHPDVIQRYIESLGLDGTLI